MYFEEYLDLCFNDGHDEDDEDDEDNGDYYDEYDDDDNYYSINVVIITCNNLFLFVYVFKIFVESNFTA